MFFVIPETLNFCYALKKRPDHFKVSSFVSELRRITLLWDELWLGTLAQEHQLKKKISSA